jgi:hypothetical protein
MPLRTEQQRILNILKELPHDKLDEVIDFVEHLKAKTKAVHKVKKKLCPPVIPTFHLGRIEKSALDRDALYGEYLDRKFV